MGLVEGFLGEEERPVELTFECHAQGPVAGAKFGLEMAAVLLADAGEGDDRVAAHRRGDAGLTLQLTKEVPRVNHFDPEGLFQDKQVAVSRDDGSYPRGQSGSDDRIVL